MVRKNHKQTNDQQHTSLSLLLVAASQKRAVWQLYAWNALQQALLLDLDNGVVDKEEEEKYQAQDLEVLIHL